ncbi:hypothetical protein JCM16303_003796 [Sporobolomyces ruberrimus]
MAKALMRYPYDIKLPDELVEPGYGPLHVPSLLQVEKKLQTINGASAPFVPTVRKASGGIFPFALWKGRLEIELSSQVHVLSETQQAIPTEEYKILLCMSIEQKIRVLVSQIRQELEKANSEKARERKKAKLWSLKTFFLAVSDGAKIIKVAVNHYFLDDEEFVPQLVADYKNKSPKEFVREIESYLKENQHHEGSTPAAPALCLSSRLELNTRQKRIYGFV